MYSSCRSPYRNSKQHDRNHNSSKPAQTSQHRPLLGLPRRSAKKLLTRNFYLSFFCQRGLRCGSLSCSSFPQLLVRSGCCPTTLLIIPTKKISISTQRREK